MELVDNHVDSHEPLEFVYVLSNARHFCEYDELLSELAVISNPVLDDQLLSVTIVDASVKYGLFVPLWVVVVFLNMYAAPALDAPVSSYFAPMIA